MRYTVGRIVQWILITREGKSEDTLPFLTKCLKLFDYAGLTWALIKLEFLNSNFLSYRIEPALDSNKDAVYPDAPEGSRHEMS